MVERTNLFAAAVVDKLAGGVLTRALDSIIGHLLDGVTETRATLLAQSDEVGTETANVRRSHGSTRESISAAAWLKGGDILSWGKDVDYKEIVNFSSMSYQR